MTPQKYLYQLLTTSGSHTFSSEEQKILDSLGIENFIFSRLSSKKFRKTKMDENCMARTKKAIGLRYEKNEPIHIVFPQGGYKLWRFPSSPTADWAEFFNISYLLKYVAPIARAYQPGVVITYYLHTLLMELHDNLTTEEIAEYVNSFQFLLDSFSRYLPKNITLKILRDADLYSRDEYFLALEAGKKLAEKEYQSFPESKKADLARMAELNIKWNGKEDWTKLNEEQKTEKIYDAALYEMSAVSQLSRVFEKVKSDENVLVFNKATKDFIGIGSTKASVAKHWVGFGVLQKKADSFLPIVLTPKQFSHALTKDHEDLVVNLISLPNFDRIFIFESFYNC